MKWGVFQDSDSSHKYEWVHVAPVTDDEQLMPPHCLSISCSCNPEIDFDGGGSPLVVHEVIQ